MNSKIIEKETPQLTQRSTGIHVAFDYDSIIPRAGQTKKFLNLKVELNNPWESASRNI